MARTALIVKSDRKKRQVEKSLAAGKKPRFIVRVYNRCPLCGRRHGYMRRFNMCRICFREHARQGKIMGLRKSSW